jgi:dephospho-CoA kinase
MEAGKIALTGGIATGKSTVAEMFRALGAVIIDADAAAREVVKPGEICWAELKAYLGVDFFDEHGDLKRAKLRERVISDEACRSNINTLLHPHILKRMENCWRVSRENHPDAIILFDIPLLFEIHLAPRFEIIILVYTQRDVQIQRLMARDGLTRAEAEQTLTIQLPIESKRSRAHLIVDNSYDLSNTRQQVTNIWNSIVHHSSRNIST